MQFSSRGPLHSKHCLLPLVLAADLVEVTEKVSESRDPKDDKFLELGVHARANAIITGDQGLLVRSPFRAIPILEPRWFLDLLSRRRSGER